MAKIYQISVVGFKGDRKLIDVANSEAEFSKTTISVFKEKLLVKFPELKGTEFILMFTKTSLKDNDTLSQHKIQHRSTIFMISILPGGGGGTSPTVE